LKRRVAAPRRDSNSTCGPAYLAGTAACVLSLLVHTPMEGIMKLSKQDSTGCSLQLELEL